MGIIRLSSKIQKVLTNDRMVTPDKNYTSPVRSKEYRYECYYSQHLGRSELMEDGKIYQTQFYNFDAFISLIPHINFPRIYGSTREILRSHGEKVFSRGSVKKIS